MTRATSAVQWAPRVAGIGVSLFLALFALDAFDGQSLLDAIPAFLIHLIPAALALAVVVVAWRWPLVGAVVFPLLAFAYGMLVHWRLDWAAGIGGPLVVLGILFFVSWRTAGPGSASHSA